MNKTIMASLSILVLVIGLGSNALYHQAEAKGMPKCWLNPDGTVKAQYLKILKGTTGANQNFNLPTGMNYCQYHVTPK